VWDGGSRHGGMDLLGGRVLGFARERASAEGAAIMKMADMQGTFYAPKAVDRRGSHPTRRMHARLGKLRRSSESCVSISAG
jgi:hypothetical protein